MDRMKRYRVEVRSSDAVTVTVIEDVVAIETRVEGCDEFRDLLVLSPRVGLPPRSDLLITDVIGTVHRFRAGQWREYRWQEVTG